MAMVRPHIDPELIAAPPDDGGHFGNLSIPSDDLLVRSAPRPGMPRERTPTHEDPTLTGTMMKQPPKAGLGIIGGLVLLLAISLISVVIALLLGTSLSL
jgi:hypothetical protein